MTSDDLFASTGESVSIEWIFPETARTYLALNIGFNRNLSPDRVDFYAKQMAAGEWSFTGAAIQFNDDGLLIDGQHRLSAVIKANVPIQMVVIRDLHKEALPRIDAGKIRNHADAVRLDNVRYATEKSALAKFLISRSRGRTSTTGQFFTNDEVVEFVRTHDLEPAIMTMKRELGQLPFNKTMASAAFYLCHEKDALEANEFWVNQVSRTLGLQPGSPAHALRERLSRDDRGNTLVHSRQAYSSQFAFAITSWNHFRAGKRVTKLSLPAGGWTSSNFPSPR